MTSRPAACVHFYFSVVEMLAGKSLCARIVETGKKSFLQLPVMCALLPNNGTKGHNFHNDYNIGHCGQQYDASRCIMEFSLPFLIYDWPFSLRRV